MLVSATCGREYVQSRLTDASAGNTEFILYLYYNCKPTLAHPCKLCFLITLAVLTNVSMMENKCDAMNTWHKEKMERHE